jgi:hypothetical protein
MKSKLSTDDLKDQWLMLRLADTVQEYGHLCLIKCQQEKIIFWNGLNYNDNPSEKLNYFDNQTYDSIANTITSDKSWSIFGYKKTFPKFGKHMVITDADLKINI